MKRILFLLLFTYPLIGSPDPNPEARKSVRGWYFLLRALSFLFPYANNQPLSHHSDHESTS
jgi:hypothetical protein